MCDIKGRHDLISVRVDKAGRPRTLTHKRYKTTTVFFSGEYGFSVLPSSLQSAIYSCPHRTSPFLEPVATTQTTMMLAYNTQQILLFSLSGAVFDTLRSYHTGLRCDLRLL